MRKVLISLFLVATAALTTGCATAIPGAGSAASPAASRTEQVVRLGTVYSVRKVNIERSDYSGALKGGLVGGFAGLLAGDGSKLVAVLGAAGGALVGQAMSEKPMPLVGQEITVQLESGGLVAITQVEDTNVSFRKGARVRITGSGETSRVSLAI